MNKLLKTFNVILSAILGLLGFQSCDTIAGGVAEEYGCPYAEFKIDGKVLDEEGKPVADENIVVRPLDYEGNPIYGYNLVETKTDAQGYFLVETNYATDKKVHVVAIDPDKVYEDDSTDVTLTQTKKGDGHWYQGEYSANVNFKLKKK